MKNARFSIKNIVVLLIVIAVIIFVYFLINNQWDVQAAAQEMTSMFSKS